MLFLLVSCLSFLLLSQSFLKSNPTPKMESRVWTLPWIFKEILMLLAKKRKNFISVFQVPSIKKILSPQFESVEENDVKKQENSLLDLPDLVLDCILERLSPAELCRMAGVCISMREKCTSDHLWQKIMKEKWGEIIGDAAHREWQSQIGLKKALEFLNFTEKRNKFSLFSTLLGYKPEMEKRRSFSPPNSVMSCYLALERGKFWFPAQVFNRENGHVGFMLSCYDAQLSYGSTTDNFVARYKAQGRCMIEDGIEWERIRTPIVDTPPNVLHISSCLDELRPDDHIEIQWRKNNDFPYGWWYGVVGHLDSCSGNEFSCQCHASDSVVLEFKQYSPESRWRKTKINRKSHRQVGNEVDGFYGGIRKLTNKKEIQKWKQLWPNCTLE